MQSVGGWLDLSYSNINSLGNLKSVGRNLWLQNSKITSLGNLQKVGDAIHLYNDHKIPEELMKEYRKKFNFVIDSMFKIFDQV